MTAESPGEPPRILNYANKPVQGSPEWYTVLNGMMDAHCTPREIRPYFGTDIEALNYFSQATTRRFSDDQAGGPCILCRTEPAEELASLVWSAEMHYRTFEIVVSASPKVDFHTWHAICNPCAQRFNRQKRWRRFMSSMLFVLIVGTGVLLWLANVKDGVTRDVPGWLMESAMVLMGMILFSVVVLKIMPRRWPAHLYALMPEGVTLKYISGVSRRELRDEG